MANRNVIRALEAEFRTAKATAERAMAQVGDADLHAQFDPRQNGIAITVQHLAGNMRSRWTDFLTTDGEKPSRDREGEFAERNLSRAELAELWEKGWACALDGMAALTDGDLSRVVTIRGEPHTVLRAVLRQLTHATWHVSQIALLAKHFAGDRWQYLTKPPGGSTAHDADRGVPSPPPPAEAIRLLAISGSLRAGSSNGAVVAAAAAVAPAGVTVDVYAGVGLLPHYNPDADHGPVPATVAALRAAVRAADALLLCSPEYAHGVPGSLKNALDWLVSNGELMGKPVAVVNASPQAKHARAALVETLSVLMATVVDAASVTLPLPRNTITAAEIGADTRLADPLRAAVAALARAARTARDQGA